jgi:alpha-galactosidase
MKDEVSIGQRRRGPLLGNRYLEVRCDMPAGTLSILNRATGLPSLARWSSQVELGEPPSLTLSTADTGFRREYALEQVADEHGSGRLLTLAAVPTGGRPELRLLLTVYDERPFVLLQLELANTTGRPLRVESLTVLTTPSAGRHRLRLGSRASRWSFYRQGWQSWTPVRAVSAREEDLFTPATVLGPFPPASQGRGRFVADEVGLVHDAGSGASLLAGFVTAHDQLSQVRLHAADRALEAHCHADGIELPPGGRLRSEKLMLDLEGPPLEALERYGDALARQMGARVPAGAAPTGWCSWYRYFLNVSEEDMLKNLRFLAEHREELPMEYVQLDDGYESDIGDWTSWNEKFPHGPAWLAQQIRDAGFTPGLWLAPFMAASTSALYREHPDWVVRDQAGVPVLAMHNWGKDCYGLDCSHPQALRWIEELFRQVTEEWGFDYVKIDFLFAAAVEGVRSDPQVTRVQAYRQGLEAIRRGVGERFVLGCGALMGPSVGLVDGMRIGPDVAPWWRPPGESRARRLRGSLPASENSLRNVLTRFWTHRRLWLNDPDCLLVRDESTALTLDEVRTLVAAIGLSGGMMLSSDDLTALPADRRELISLLLPPFEETARPLDLLDRPLPRLFELRVVRPFGSWRVVALFNWGDRRASLSYSLPPGRFHVYDLWSDRYLGAHEGAVTVDGLPAHGSAVLAVRPDSGEPQVVSSTFHITQGGAEIEDARYDAGRRSLELSLRPVARKEGSILVHVPPTLRERALEADAPDARLHRRDDGLLAVRLPLHRPTSLRIRFEAV